MTANNTVGASERTLRILECLEENGGMGVSELAAEFDLPKSTVHNHLDTLRRNEYVVKRDGIYKLGLRFLKLGAHARTRKQVYEEGKAEVNELAQKTGALANLAVEEYREGVYLYLAQGDQAVELDTYAGMRFSLHCTALGKAILAHLPEERRRNIIASHDLPRCTPNTITDAEELTEELATVRDQGFAQDRAERLEGLRCVAAPIQGGTDSILGAISVSAPTSRMKDEQFNDKIPEEVLDAANVIELNIKF